jgi:predicted ATPase
VYLVDLTTSSEPNSVTPAIAHVVSTGATGQAPEDIAAALRRALRNHRALIILDNFEGVLPAGAMLVEMLAAYPRLTVLTTSREPARTAMEEAQSESRKREGIESWLCSVPDRGLEANAGEIGVALV